MRISLIRHMLGPEAAGDASATVLGEAVVPDPAGKEGSVDAHTQAPLIRHLT
jgi:hypothetical protein